MISEKQLAANRRNARHSTGPRTDAGRKASSLNARRHNLTGQVTAMTETARLERASQTDFTHRKPHKLQTRAA